MRIIGGCCKGRRLSFPRWDGLRPTSDRLRETLFNILGDRVRDAVVMDGCAGTGAIGLEALSRGAKEVVFVEKDKRAVRLVAQNIALCDLKKRGTIVLGALPGVLSRHDVPGEFDLILLDPPYEYDEEGIRAMLAALSLRLAADGFLVLERRRNSGTSLVSGLMHLRRITSGDSVLEFYGQAHD